LLNAQYFDSYKQLFDARVNKANTTPAQSHDSAVPAIKPKESSAPAPMAPANEPKTTMLDVKAAEFLAMALIDKLNRLEAEVQAAQERMTTAQNAATQAQERVERAQQATQTAEDNVKEIAAQITEKLQSGSFDFADLRARGEQETRNAHQAKQELNAANFDKRNADFQFNMALEEYKTKRGIFVAAKSKVEQRNQALREKAELEKAAAAKDKEARDLDAELIKLLGGYSSLGD
jgi:chromosome segregation ATPase